MGRACNTNGGYELSEEARSSVGGTECRTAYIGEGITAARCRGCARFCYLSGDLQPYFSPSFTSPFRFIRINNKRGSLLKWWAPMRDVMQVKSL
jgi:hypothetical protein